MRGISAMLVAVLAMSGAVVSVSGTALSQQQPARPAAPDAPVAQDAPVVLSAEDQDADPFPPAPDAALVKHVCSACHAATPVLDQRYSREDAERYYANMVGSDLSSRQAQKVIAYLSTVLGQ